MLIICNGAFKSGSSWLHAILVELTIVKKLNLKKVPIKYTNDINSPTTIIESRLQDFLFYEDYKTENYLTKAHFFKISTLRKEYSNDIRMLFIERNMRDAVVSHYFHIRNKYRFKISFVLYYYFLGRYKAYEIGIFNDRCKEFMGAERFFNFEDLISNFEDTIRGIAKVLDINEISNKEIATIKKETSLDKLREELKKGNISYYPSKRKDNWKLFREGKVNSWKNHFNDNQIKDIEKIESGFFSIFSRIIYYVIFTLRRLIFRIE
tara:strand:+ start:19 stop:813 length:795 start_codon:yes stop_codon:yes gene_type:complete